MKPPRWRRGGWVAERWRYRAAQRTRAADLAAAVDHELSSVAGDEWMRALGPCFTDVGVDCRHGCNGACVESGGERCNFACHG